MISIVVNLEVIAEILLFFTAAVRTEEASFDERFSKKIL